MTLLILTRNIYLYKYFRTHWKYSNKMNILTRNAHNALCLLLDEKLGQLNYPARRIKAKIVRNLFSN